MRARGAEAANGADVPFGVGRSRPRLRVGYGDVLAAARWLVENRQALRDAGKNPIPALQREFGLTSKQCVEAIRHANAAEQRGR
jgi:hypothetical protein